ncbi:MAG: AMP-binding protein [Anaerolineae bacterium]|nr:AMP-binding protein [Anaerolineae bacterium]
MNIGSLVTRHARYRPDHLAVVVGNHRLTWKDFNHRVNRLANALFGMGIRKGDKIAIILPNCLELLDIYWAVAKIGAVVVPLSPLLRGQGLTTLLRDSDAVMVITNSAFIDVLNPIKPKLPAVAANRYILTDVQGMTGYHDYQTLINAVSGIEPGGIDVNSHDLYNIMYSSGTTGLPKGIMHTHHIRAMYGMSFAQSFRIMPESVVLHTGSLVFNGAFVTYIPAFFVGATFILHQQFDPVDFIETIEREKVTHVMLVPSQIIAILNAPNFSAEALQSLEMIGSIGAPLHNRYKELLDKHLPCRFYELYGLTEGFVTILDKFDAEKKLDSVGIPPPFFDIKIFTDDGDEAAVGEVGEIAGHGTIQMLGYYKRPDLTEETVVDGWIRSGDLGYVDEDGYLYLVDRKKDLVISGGVNVYPKDIEEVIVQHPAVREVAVFGVPHDKWGETPLAAVILNQADAITAEELKTWVNNKVEARYQRISEVVIMDDFPRNAAGKTLKRVMREPYWAEEDVQI